MEKYMKNIKIWVISLFFILGTLSGLKIVSAHNNGIHLENDEQARTSPISQRYSPLEKILSQGYNEKNYRILLKNLDKMVIDGDYTYSELTELAGYSGKNGKRDFETMKRWGKQGRGKDSLRKKRWEFIYNNARVPAPDEMDDSSAKQPSKVGGPLPLMMVGQTAIPISLGAHILSFFEHKDHWRAGHVSKGWRRAAEKAWDGKAQHLSLISRKKPLSEEEKENILKEIDIVYDYYVMFEYYKHGRYNNIVNNILNDGQSMTKSLKLRRCSNLL